MRPTNYPHIAISQSNGKIRIDFRKQVSPVDKTIFFSALVILTWVLYDWFPNLFQPFVFDASYIGFTAFLYLFFFVLFGSSIFFPKRQWIFIDDEKVVFGFKTVLRKGERSFDKVNMQELSHSKSKSNTDDGSFLRYILNISVNVGSTISIGFKYRDIQYVYLYRLEIDEADEIIMLMLDSNQQK